MYLNKKNTNTDRCPWCGEINNNIFRFARCRECNKKYYYSYYTTSFLLIELPILFLTAIIFVLLLEHLILSILTFVIGFAFLYLSPTHPLLKRSNNKQELIKQTSFKANISFYKELNYRVKINSIFLKDRIYPICFVNDDDEPISQTVCVCVENYNRKAKTAELSFLPLGNKLDRDICDLKFYIFDIGKKIGEGKCIETSFTFEG